MLHIEVNLDYSFICTYTFTDMGSSDLSVQSVFVRKSARSQLSTQHYSRLLHFFISSFFHF